MVQVRPEFFDSPFPDGYHPQMAADLTINEFFKEVERKVRVLLRLNQHTPVRNRFDLTDVLQEVNVQICNRLNDDQSIDRCLETAWLRRVATGHFCKLQRLNLAKKRSVAREVPRNMGSVAGQASAAEQVAKDEQAAILLACLEQVEPDVRHVLVRRNYDCASFREIAEELGVSQYDARILHRNGLKTMGSMMNGRTVQS